MSPDLRKYWIAGMTIQIIDTHNNQLMAEKTSYAFEPGLGSKAGNRVPWAFAKTCPHENEPVRNARLFADKIIQPKQRD